MATDVAEVLGAAIGFHLLFGIPLLTAGAITAVVTFAILGLQRHGFRLLELVIAAKVGVIAICYILETRLAAPDAGEIARHAVFPELQGTDSVLLAVGILGATVMPHVVFLHSHLTQRRIPALAPDQAKRAFHFEAVDVVIAMALAGLVNAAMLIMAATTFHTAGFSSIGSIEAVTLLPAFGVIAIGLDPSRTLVVSQVVILSFCLPAALIPLVLFTSRRAVMADLVNKKTTSALAALVTALILALNLLLVSRTLSGAS